MPRLPTGEGALERLNSDPRFADLSEVARVLLASAWAGGAALRPGSSPEDLERLVIAELLVFHGHDPAEALRRARGTIKDGHLRGAVRFAAARHAKDQLGPALRGVRSVRELSRSSAAELASWLFALPADEPDEETTVAAALEFRRREPELDGPVLGGCSRCGSPVVAGGATIAVWYFIPGRRRPGSEERAPGRYEWRAFSALVELGAYVDDATWKRRLKKLPEVVRQARDGGDLLCPSCTGRARLKLIDWPAAPEGELDVPGRREL